jgi:ABC-type nitrate/sulfonate/bicarbonate transport system substrate-binding protein
LAALVGAACLIALLAGCGSSDSAATTGATGAAATSTQASADGGLTERTKATLILDFIPNAVHAGIYHALEAGYYDDANVDLKIVAPSGTSDGVKLVGADKAQFGIATGGFLGITLAGGGNQQGVMALLQRPVTGIMYLRKSGFTSPKDLEGKLVGRAGNVDPSFDTIVANAGGDPAKTKQVIVGFNGIASLESDKVAAFAGFWPTDVTQLEQDGFDAASWALSDNGGPDFPGLVLFTNREVEAENPALVRAFVDATVHGYEDTLADPEASLDDLLKQNPVLKRPYTKAVLDKYLPLFQGDAASFGEFSESVNKGLADWLVETRQIDEPFDPAAYATNEYLPSGGS